MPELPEVETTRRGLRAAVEGGRIAEAVVRHRGLRQPVPRGLEQQLAGATVQSLDRRGKYLLFECTRNGHRSGTLIVHLGMSGRLWLVDRDTPPQKHDHFDLAMDHGRVIRLRDPRRFGLVLWQRGPALEHPLLRDIGPEPLTDDFDGAQLHRETRSRSAAIKLAIMDSHLVCGVGNIYANEALFRAGIDPRTPSKRLSKARCDALAREIKAVLGEAINAGGSSLRDYVGSDGMAGNFQNNFLVYGRAGEACTRCGSMIRETKQAQRATCFCPHCQKR
ncbi:MAG: bifunctional DNA-formamidopyrimidine glycosylase/DNA-(apurinic or apyrimidinic site) lyase [Betaproteobacteria bacterium]|jgi:formamidopyrimidine-DNA glycosylase|nr:bifunctional DNA-formamidopyrimidine glycosylase/DNA-(apurinic or apyrimidinic site) lyase [Betaproteobacteria bacterium]